MKTDRVVIIVMVIVIVMTNGREADRQEGGQADDGAPATEPRHYLIVCLINACLIICIKCISLIK